MAMLQTRLAALSARLRQLQVRLQEIEHEARDIGWEVSDAADGIDEALDEEPIPLPVCPECGGSPSDETPHEAGCPRRGQS
jgi:hypothetical protein